MAVDYIENNAYVVYVPKNSIYMISGETDFTRQIVTVTPLKITSITIDVKNRYDGQLWYTLYYANCMMQYHKAKM